MNSQTISLARHTASGIKIDVGSLWWQKVKILAPVRESARVHQDHPCLYSSRAKIGVSDPGKIPPTCSSTQSRSHGYVDGFFTRQNVSADTYFQYHYIIDLHNKIKTSCRIAQDSASEVAEAIRQRHEPKSRLKVFEPSELVMVLLPQSNNKLVLQLQGPFERNATDILLPQPTHDELADEDLALKFSKGITFAPPEGVAYVSAVTEDPSSVGGTLPSPFTSDIKSRVRINPMLDSYKLSEVNDILDEFSDVLTALPGHIPSIMHQIELTTDVPIRIKPYPLPFSSQEFVREETTKLLDLGVIEPSTSSSCSPIVLVKKKDGSLRLCIDFRRISEVTRFDANNIPLPEDLLVQLANSTVFFSCDLSCAYWQVPLSSDCRVKRFFATLTE
ncbi:reverse transcriptase [Plakobranchus ocellatus]|uniref:Reverse transcriptase n=1 Tax=Plakobranchus ocellatus TaxID=259542 RepID=A0AAV3ZH13_9GAST|nr:reverse transcriptase [Plakobranchus ocellatus]